MKKKIILFLGVCSVLFLLAGFYIIFSIERTTSTLDTLIKLHQVEILREHLLIRVKGVQEDLSLKGTRHARGIDVIVQDVRNMAAAVDICFACHHSEQVTTRLSDLKNHVAQYKDKLSRILTLRANAPRMALEEDDAFKMGDELILKVNTMIALTNRKLMERTALVLGDISRSKHMLFTVVALGPFVAVGFGFFFIRSLTGPVNELLTATRKLKGGDLQYRVGPLKDEFREMAESFNEMASSIREQMHTIEESEMRYRTLFERAGDAIFIIDAEGENKFRILAANQAAADIHGYTVAELMRMNINDVGAPGSNERTPSPFSGIMRGEWVKAEVMHRKKDGTVFPVEVSAGQLELGNHKYILAFDRDLSGRKQAEEALQRTEQLRVAGDLAAGLTHELKNSLAGIKISIEVLLDELSLSDEDRNVLMRMIREIRRIELLMRDLLNFARPSKPQLAFVNINTILDTAMTFSLRSVGSSSDGSSLITLVKELDPNIPRTMADPMQLQQVFMNLLMNAVESMPSGGSLTVKTVYEAQNDLIRISISDTGRGVDEELINRIFDPFVTTKPKGTGLGLPITKGIVEQHRGTIHLANNPGGGATFSIVLPVKHVEEVVII